MRKYQMSPALAATIHAVRTAPFREVQVPLYLELPREDLLRAPSCGEHDDDDAFGAEAGGWVIDPTDEDDDDFY